MNMPMCSYASWYVKLEQVYMELVQWNGRCNAVFIREAQHAGNTHLTSSFNGKLQVLW